MRNSCFALRSAQPALSRIANPGFPAIYLTCLIPQTHLPEPSISEVREELQRVLASPRFRQSPRLSKLLRYICMSALSEDREQITEYTIALDVLGKNGDFKEGKDAIVRVEVHRLRKRLAEFYDDEGAGHRVRIAIPTGGYTPRFKVQDDQPYAIALPEPPIESKPVTAPIPRRWQGLSNRVWVAAIALLVVALLPAYQVFRSEDQTLDAFWKPVLSSSSPILLCMGNLAGGHTHPEPEGTAENGALTLKDFHSAKNQMVHAADAATLARFASLIQAKGRRYRIVSQSDTTYADLQNSPAVLIGLLNNDWTKRLVGNLRFTVDRPAGGKVLIRDRADPSRGDWFIDYYAPYLEIAKDYALVVRATDPKTEQMTVMAAGMSIFGTLAAGEFLTNPIEIRKLDAVAPKAWRRMNLEVVLSTDVIRGNPGPPKVVATHFW
jgi:hypothetical protein